MKTVSDGSVKLRDAAVKFLDALDVISDMNDRGRDDSGERPTSSYWEWLLAECRYTEALFELRACVRGDEDVGIGDSDT